MFNLELFTAHNALRRIPIGRLLPNSHLIRSAENGPTGVSLSLSSRSALRAKLKIGFGDTESECTAAPQRKILDVRGTSQLGNTKGG